MGPAFLTRSAITVIAGNMVRRNGFSIGWYTGAGILIHASSDVEVRDNHVLDNANGIIALQQDRGNGPQGLHQVKNVYVHDNHVGMAVGASGLAFDPKYTGVQTANGTRFESNSYEISGQRQSFVWLGKALTKNQWIDQGHDTNGKFLPHQ
jgi:nitrous oxidase accessory protein NosD